MAVTVMQIGIMRVLMAQWRMMVPVRMQFAGGIVRPMRMSMMIVVDMTMLMLERLMNMLMRVALGQVQIKSDPHQQSRHRQPR